jgi:hypothetical protein
MRNHRRAMNVRQHGMSVIGMIATMAVVVVLVVLALRLAPHYIDYQTLRVVMDGLPGQEIHEMDKRAIYESLEKRFKINNLRSFKVRDVVSIERDKTATTLLVNYEIREPLLLNADIVLVFDEKYSYR